MRISRFCACGGALVGRAHPNAVKAFSDAFDAVHNKPGCAPATPEQARAARRRAERQVRAR